MAEGGTQTVLCRYFMHGACRNGEQCHFSHNRESRPSMVCRFYLKGSCQYGQQCRFDHHRPERNKSPAKKLPECGANSNPSLVPQVPKPCILKTSASSSNLFTLSNASSCQELLKDVDTVKTSWADAPEFVPRLPMLKYLPDVASSSEPLFISYADVTSAGTSNNFGCQNVPGRVADDELCPLFLISGICQLGTDCPHIHGDLCEVCQLACLHPYSAEQRKLHVDKCSKLMEAEMEHSFAMARSRDRVCGICMDNVIDRSLVSQRRFGILPNCSHCFCLDCIRKWRQSKQFENKIVRSCPECRTQSDFIVPSRYWVDDKDKPEKDKLLSSYRASLSLKACKYYKQGEGQCPFGNKCFYQHALPDGTVQDVGPPRRTRRCNGENELAMYLDNAMLWDFIEEREQRLELIRGSIQTLLMELELEDSVDDFFFADDSLSEASDASGPYLI